MAENEKKKPNPNIADAVPGMTGNQASTTPGENAPPGGGGFGDGRTVDQNKLGYENPIFAARAWMQENGINPNAANPLVQRQLQAASGANRLFDLSTNLQNAGGADFMDFLGNFLQNRNTPGAGPMFSKEQIDALVRQAVGSALSYTGTDTETGAGINGSPWADMFLSTAQVDPETGQSYSPSAGDQANALKAFLAPAYADVTNPFALQSITEGVDRGAANWQTDLMSPGAPNMDSFLVWLMNNGGVPGGAI